jgi:hypothetical protein
MSSGRLTVSPSRSQLANRLTQNPQTDYVSHEEDATVDPALIGESAGAFIVGRDWALKLNAREV